MRSIPCLVTLGLCALLPAQEDKVLRKPFAQLDTDKDGSIQATEFPGNPALFALMDKDRDKKISFDEYKVSILARRYLAAVRISKDEARTRIGARDLAHRRLQIISRFDRNRDGKIQKSEWTGAPGAFLSLDLDGNGVIDKRDKAQAQSENSILDRALAKLPEIRKALPNAGAALRTLDKDKDGFLNRKEVARSPIEPVFRYADTNEDDLLDRVELDRVAKAVNAQIAQRDEGYARPRAPTIPFRTWDKDNDGRIDIKEWIDRKYLFPLIDINRDAAVTEEELLRYKKSIEGENFLEKFDLNGDRRVTPEEFAGARAAFDRADRNGDGVISNRDR